MWGDRLVVENAGNTSGGGSGSPAGPVSVISDSAAAAGQVAKVASGGHVTLATGPTEADNEGLCAIYGAAVLAGAQVSVYPPGTRAPIAGLPVGEVFRNSSGSLVAWGDPSLTSGNYTRRCGNSSGIDVWVDFGPVFQVP